MIYPPAPSGRHRPYCPWRTRRSSLSGIDAAGVWPVLVDAHQLENALLNLSINARDAMPDGGMLTIETANLWMDELTGRELDLRPGRYVSLRVSDNGSGMAPEVVERAYDPFFTTKPQAMSWMARNDIAWAGPAARFVSTPPCVTRMDALRDASPMMRLAWKTAVHWKPCTREGARMASWRPPSPRPSARSRQGASRRRARPP